MPGFVGYDQIINALTVNLTGQKLFFSKVAASVSVANVPQDLWTASGLPAAGAYGAAGKANGRTLTSTTTGALPYSDPTAPATMHLLAGEATVITANATGSLILVDHISDVLLAHAEATGAITGVDATSRLPSEGGCQLFCSVVTAFSAASNTITFTYTNQAGTAGRVTGNIVTVASAIVRRSVNGNLWQPLAAGDSGIRSIQSVTLSAGAATGQYVAKLVRPLATIPIGTVGLTTARDFVVELPNLDKIYDSSNLALIYVPTAAVTQTLFGEIRIASN